jgi:hypothetical protein
MVIGTKCSEHCGKGIKFISELVERKDPSADASWCAAWRQQSCNTQACGNLNFFVAGPGGLPLRGEWLDLLIVFTPQEAADSVELLAPVGFTIARAAPGAPSRSERGACLLVEHNMPRLDECNVHRTEGKRDKITLSFLNPLEPPAALVLENSLQANEHASSASYKLRLWVEHPKECSGGISERGICKGDRMWLLTERSRMDAGGGPGAGARGPDAHWDSVEGGYELFSSGEAERKAVREEKTDVHSGELRVPGESGSRLVRDAGVVTTQALKQKVLRKQRLQEAVAAAVDGAVEAAVSKGDESPAEIAKAGSIAAKRVLEKVDTDCTGCKNDCKNGSNVDATNASSLVDVNASGSNNSPLHHAQRSITLVTTADGAVGRGQKSSNRPRRNDDA